MNNNLREILKDEYLSSVYYYDPYFFRVINFAIKYDLPLFDTLIMIIRILYKETERLEKRYQKIVRMDEML